ncbi:hypothetical protein BJ165DRAFT_566943 [Panaeolus papilionaceus]|nr:hypothetical protein BJ165DRAFT_566943 [Panaeolus papilionaceus]
MIYYLFFIRIVILFFIPFSLVNLHHFGHIHSSSFRPHLNKHPLTHIQLDDSAAFSASRLLSISHKFKAFVQTPFSSSFSYLDFHRLLRHLNSLTERTALISITIMIDQ